MNIEEIKKMSTVEIKALIYDMAIEIEQGQGQIRMLNTILQDRLKVLPTINSKKEIK